MNIFGKLHNLTTEQRKEFKSKLEAIDVVEFREYDEDTNSWDDWEENGHIATETFNLTPA